MNTKKMGEMTATDSRTPRKFSRVRLASRRNVKGPRSGCIAGGNKLNIDSEQLASEIAIVST